MACFLGLQDAHSESTYVNKYNMQYNTHTRAQTHTLCLLQPGLYASNLHDPSDVQRVAIPAILAGGNVAVRSYTGSGKTLAFLLPVLSLAIQR